MPRVYVKKSNTIISEFEDGSLLIDISSKKFPNSTMKIDRVDWDRLKEMKIGRISDDGRGYAQCGSGLIHRLLNPEWKYIDHINHDKTDNRRSNLREVSNQQNQMNQKIKNNNTSGFKGVSKQGKKFKSMIMIDGKRKFIGYFNTPIEAAIAYDKEAEEHFGEFACTNKSMGLI